MKPNKRYLVIDKDSSQWALHREDGNPIEVKCLELSPKGRAKIQFLSGHISWVNPSEYHVVEELT